MNLEFLTTRTIYEEPSISQRLLAKKLFLSLGKINSVVNDAIKSNLIIKNENEGFYKVTEKGLDLLNKHIVDAAIIFACGKGIKINPYEYDIPICFLEIKGERLIERQIKQLKSVGINDITIMVGFMKEKFDYLIDKYNVKLVYNDEYKYKNTLATFNCARELMKNKNVYISVSDIYMEENIFETYEIEPHFTGMFFENCKNEWRIISNTKNEVKRVEIGGDNDFCLIGPCFLTKEYLDEFLPMIENYYNMNFTDKYYWEEVLVNNLDKLPTIYVYKYDKDTILEFDNLKDIDDYNKVDKDFNSKILDYIKESFSNKNLIENDIHNLICDIDDVANYYYTFNIKDENYNIRIPKNNSNKFIDRKNEIDIINQIRSLNISEEVVSFDIKSGFKISKNIEKSHMINIDNDNELNLCMSTYKKLHTSGIRVEKSADIINQIENYIDIINKNNIMIPYEDFNTTLDEARKIRKKIEEFKRPVTICHGDPSIYNILISDNRCFIKEFEYGGMADPLSDISQLGVCATFSIDKTLKLYDMYKTVSNDNELLPKSDSDAKLLITYYMALSGFYNAVWSIVRNATSDADYGAFGLNGYRTFKNLSKCIYE